MKTLMNDDVNVEAPKKRNFLLRLVSGDIGLAQTFWVYHIGISIVLVVLMMGIGSLVADGNPTLATARTFFVMWLLLAGFTIPYTLVMLVAVCRSAIKYTGSRVYSVLAISLMVIGVVVNGPEFIELPGIWLDMAGLLLKTF